MNLFSATFPLNLLTYWVCVQAHYGTYSGEERAGDSLEPVGHISGDHSVLFEKSSVTSSCGRPRNKWLKWREISVPQSTNKPEHEELYFRITSFHPCSNPERKYTPHKSSVRFNLALRSYILTAKAIHRDHVTFIKTSVSKQPTSDPFDRYSKHFQSLPLDSSRSIAAEMLFHHWTQWPRQ